MIIAAVLTALVPGPCFAPQLGNPGGWVSPRGLSSRSLKRFLKQNNTEPSSSGGTLPRHRTYEGFKTHFDLCLTWMIVCECFKTLCLCKIQHPENVIKNCCFWVSGGQCSGGQEARRHRLQCLQRRGERGHWSTLLTGQNRLQLLCERHWPVGNIFCG